MQSYGRDRIRTGSTGTRRIRYILTVIIIIIIITIIVTIIIVTIIIALLRNYTINVYINTRRPSGSPQGPSAPFPPRACFTVTYT